MNKKMLFFLLAICLTVKGFAQCTALVYDAGNFAHTNLSTILELDIEEDFCADGSDALNDQAAFEAASNFINARGGYCRLTIPAGTYIVGNQSSSLGYFAYAPNNVLNIQNCANVEIIGIDKPTIRYRDGLHYGYFNESTGAPLSDADATGISIGSANPTEAKWAIMNFMINISYERTGTSYFKISNLILDGNVYPGTIFLGGKDEIQGIQLPFDGIRIWEAANVTIENVTVKRFGRDGIYIGNRTDQKNVKIRQCLSEYNGRQALTIAAGDSISVIDSKLNSAGMGEIASIPCSGVNIEEELTVQMAQNVVFSNCSFEQNRKAAIDITSGNGVGKGFFFNNCDIIAMKNPETTIPGANNGNVAMEIGRYKKLRFSNCNIYGVILDAGNGAMTADDGVHFTKCYFSDCYHKYNSTLNAMVAVEPYTHSTLTYVTRDGHVSDYLKIDSCHFELFTKRLWMLNTSTATPATVSNTTITLANPNTYSDNVNIGIDSNVVFQGNTFFYHYYQTYKHVSGGVAYESPYAISGINFWHWYNNNFYPPVCADTIPGTMVSGQVKPAPGNITNPIGNRFSVYPNPAINQKFYVENHFSENARYILTDINGNRIDEGTIPHDSKITLSYQQLPRGIYILKLLNTLFTQTEKVTLY